MTLRDMTVVGEVRDRSFEEMVFDSSDQG